MILHIIDYCRLLSCSLLFIFFCVVSVESSAVFECLERLNNKKRKLSAKLWGILCEIRAMVCCPFVNLKIKINGFWF